MSRKAITRIQSIVVIVVILVAIAGGAYLAIPRGPMSTTSSVSSQTVPNQDTIVQEMISPVDEVDPATEYYLPGTAIIQNVYENLMGFHGSRADQVFPWLAQSYDLSPDGLTYTFHLRSGITFSDGTAFNATAVYFSLMRAMIIDDPNGPAWALLQVVRGGMNYSKQYNNAGPSAPNGYGANYTQAELNDFINAKGIEIVDPMTVAIHLEHPYAAFPSVLAFSVAAIVSPTAFIAHWAPTPGKPYIPGATAGDYADQYNPWPANNMVGTGPYTLKSWDKSSQVMVLARNENYWGGPFNRGLAPEPNVIIKAGIDLNTRVLDLLSGATDLANFPYEGVDAFPGGTVWQFVNKTTWFSENKLVPLNPDIQVYPQTGLWPELSTAGVTFNQRIMDINGNPQAFQPFADIRIRKAFTLCFNRTSYLQNVLYNFAAAGTQILPSSMFGYDPTIQPTPFDPATAESLLLDAGAHPLTPANAFSPARPVTLNIAYQLGMAARATVATMITSCINSFSSSTGLTVNSGGVSEPQLVSMRRTHQVQIWFLDWSVDYVDPDDFLVPFASATAGFYPAFTSYNNTEVTKLVAQQASITDPTQRLQVIHQIENLVNQDWQYIWLQKDSTYTISRSWLHERPNASIASGVENYNPEMDGYYYYEIEKGPPTSSAAAITNPFQVLYLGLLQTATTLPTTRRVF